MEQKSAIVFEAFLDAVVAADHLPRAAEVVGDVVVPAGGGVAIGSQLSLGAHELIVRRILYDW